ncbi:hypothetical protein MADA3029_740068 [Vibrio nigripulchritudo MADA3029]|uniref:hypothetical protein n=1 Tax=Vibrio nigripulchritudo TaxID=28173 RepID=UPI0003B19181|nr:hypothetical protein [Vibrio nigripulchritudo]CCN49164.1 hypothetical protein VIBNIMADA3020_710003 [Vibrio nigripulchritudo MADA3020]CCN54147.1 hypothetical protein VIBNIMADA3021_510070 [Vibrio nigripulchritudo MADA3021]CCN61217.1 hypothetical protein MADA3029_740068 [Vibrio nigripulchritudo MADA3029]
MDNKKLDIKLKNTTKSYIEIENKKSLIDTVSAFQNEVKRTLLKLLVEVQNENDSQENQYQFENFEKRTLTDSDYVFINKIYFDFKEKHIENHKHSIAFIKSFIAHLQQTVGSRDSIQAELQNSELVKVIDQVLEDKKQEILSTLSSEQELARAIKSINNINVSSIAKPQKRRAAKPQPKQLSSDQREQSTQENN